MNILTDLREASGITRHKLATESGLHHDIVNKYEAGKRDLSVDQIDKIANVIASRLQLAYIAGLFDRASNWSIVKVLPNPSKYRKDTGNTGPINYPVYSARIRFTTKHIILVKVLENFFGVGFTINKSKHTNSYTFFAANRKAKIVAEMLLPYLALKRSEALRIIETVTILENSKARGKPSRKIVATYLPSFRVSVYDSIKDASKCLHIPEYSIFGCCNNKQHTTKNNTYTFSYLDEYTYRDLSHHDRLEELYLEMRKR